MCVYASSTDDLKSESDLDMTEGPRELVQTTLSTAVVEFSEDRSEINRRSWKKIVDSVHAGGGWHIALLYIAQDHRLESGPGRDL